MRTLVESYVAAHFLSPVYHDLFDRQHADLVHQVSAVAALSGFRC